MSKPLMSQIFAMLDERADIAIIEATKERILGTQLRRTWELKVINEHGFNPVERRRWAYHGQTFVIEEPRKNRRGALAEDQRDLATRLGRSGCVVLFPERMDDVIETFGPEPENVADFLARAEK